jgi:hypothetical protein
MNFGVCRVVVNFKPTNHLIKIGVQHLILIRFQLLRSRLFMILSDAFFINKQPERSQFSFNLKVVLN